MHEAESLLQNLNIYGYSKLIRIHNNLQDTHVVQYMLEMSLDMSIISQIHDNNLLGKHNKLHKGFSWISEYNVSVIRGYIIFYVKCP